MLNIREFGPPFIIFLLITSPIQTKISIGSTHVSTKLRSGEACSTISLENSAPALYRRSVRSGSSIRPVL